MAIALGMFGLVVRFVLREGKEAAFDALVEQTVAAIQENEPGTLLYVVHRVDGAPRDRIFYELYADRAAFDVHEEQPHVKAFLAQRDALLERFEVDFVTPSVDAHHLEPS